MNITATEIHEGSLNEFPPNTSPGFLFLKEFLSRYDSLGPFFDGTPIELERLCTPHTFFEVNNEKVLAHQKFGMMRVRALPGGVCLLVRNVVAAKDHLMANGMRRVDFETITTTAFRNDTPGTRVTVREMNFLTLEPIGDVLHGFQGYTVFGMITSKLPS